MTDDVSWSTGGATTAQVEDLLRTRLHEAADGAAAAYPVVDPMEMLALGREAVRRRQRFTMAGVAAAAVVAVVAGWALTGNSGARLSQQPATVPVATVATAAPTLTREMFVEDGLFGVRVDGGSISTSLAGYGPSTPVVLSWGPAPGDPGASEVLVLIPEGDRPDPGSVVVSLVPDVDQLGPLQELSVGGRLVVSVRHTSPPLGMHPYAGMAYTVGGRDVRHLTPGLLHVDGTGAGDARNEGDDFSYAVRVDAGVVRVAVGRVVADQRLFVGEFTLPDGSEGILRAGDGGGFDLAYSLVRGHPRSVTVTGDTPTRFAGGISWGYVSIDGTDMTLLVIALTGTDDSSAGQLRSMTWTDDAGARHTVPAS